MGADLHSLLQDWQRGRAELIALLLSSTHDETESVADSGVGVSLIDEGVRNKRDSCGDWGPAFSGESVTSPRESLVSPNFSTLEDIFEEKVMEATAIGRTGVLGVAGISRQERIERARREREEREERKRLIEERGRWVGELKDVLGRRKRIGVLNGVGLVGWVA